MAEHDRDEALERVRADPALLGSFYQAAESRRSMLDQMMWQAPGLSVTAQAFLLTVGLQADTQPAGRMLTGALGLGVALASMQLLAKHRLHEVLLSMWLEDFESRTWLPRLNGGAERHRFEGPKAYKRLGRIGTWLARDGGTRRFRVHRGSFTWWLWTLAAFGVVNALTALLGLLAAIGLWDPLSG